jgi:hypothetical protein
MSSLEMLRALGQKSSAGVNLGRAVALLDAACAKEDLPWLGRIVIFDNAADDFVGVWSDWAPFRPFIVDAAPRSKQWSAEEFARLHAVLPTLPADPNSWWEEAAKDSDAWLRRVLLVVLRQAYGSTTTP